MLRPAAFVPAAVAKPALMCAATPIIHPASFNLVALIQGFTLPRQGFIWLGILSIMTLAKNISKSRRKNTIQRSLQGSGECPFPFILLHDPIDGLRKHPRKLALCALVWIVRRLMSPAV
mmetsp:Transcript_22687/g.37497  ORF Transcript_22687/g.37497 Transcript_22687/m.37497 type:complete len:119 (+) Transcript_22687:173-529(+)